MFRQNMKPSIYLFTMSLPITKQQYNVIVRNPGAPTFMIYMLLVLEYVVLLFVTLSVLLASDLIYEN